MFIGVNYGAFANPTVGPSLPIQQGEVLYPITVEHPGPLWRGSILLKGLRSRQVSHLRHSIVAKPSFVVFTTFDWFRKEQWTNWLGFVHSMSYNNFFWHYWYLSTALGFSRPQTLAVCWLTTPLGWKMQSAEGNAFQVCKFIALPTTNSLWKIHLQWIVFRMALLQKWHLVREHFQFFR